MRIERHAGAIGALVDETPDTRGQDCARRAGRFGKLRGALRLFRRHKIGRKNAHAVEQDRPHAVTRRKAWFDGQLDLVPDRLVFIDENLGLNQHGPYGMGAERPEAQGRRSSWTLEDYDVAPEQHRRADGGLPGDWGCGCRSGSFASDL